MADRDHGGTAAHNGGLHSPMSCTEEEEEKKKNKGERRKGKSVRGREKQNVEQE